ncbi:MAG: S8 family serine peptidase [Elusimicrobiales bacterium]|nr:S8 family serine peptidase [Elusimicrobiales bacterium]
MKSKWHFLLTAMFAMSLAAVLAAPPQRAFSADNAAAPADASARPSVQVPQELKIPPRAAEFIKSKGKEYGLALGPRGEIMQVSGEAADKASSPRILDAKTARRLVNFLSRLPENGEDAKLADTLKLFLASYNSKRESDDDICRQQGSFFVCDGGNAALTPAGKHAVMDIITAVDGQRFISEKSSYGPQQPSGAEPASVDTAKQPTGKRDLQLTALSGKTGAELFDGAAPAGGFDWNADGAKYFSGSLNGRAVKKLAQEYAVDTREKTVKVMINAKQAPDKDYSAPAQITESTALEILREAGIDPDIIAAHDARLLRTTDNILTVKVPLKEARNLGRELNSRGIASSPARKLFRLAAATMNRSPLAKATGAMLPFSLGGESDIKPYITPQEMLKTGKLNELGQGGKNAILGIIDSGLDMNHPDFKGRVLDYFDLTDDADKKDEAGHGTFDAGLAGGSGAASDGKYKGIADQTRFVIFKVFNGARETSEDIILAAMKKARDLPEEVRPQVLNMSIASNRSGAADNVSRMADSLMVESNIMVVAAAGNFDNRGISAPGASKYALTVTGVDRDKRIPDYASRGEVSDGVETYAKPDIATYAGAIHRRDSPVKITSEDYTKALLGLQPMPVNPVDGEYYQGLIAARSSDEGHTPAAWLKPSNDLTEEEQISRSRMLEHIAKQSNEALMGNPNYRYLTGTSMAAPLASGMAIDAISYLRGRGVEYNAQEIKALSMEGAADLKDSKGVSYPRETQGAGLADGTAMAANLQARAEAGVPVGNIAYMLSRRLTSREVKRLAKNPDYAMTSLGVLDKRAGHLVNTEEELDALKAALSYKQRASVVSCSDFSADCYQNN